jgi:hypothetical protein
LQTLKYYNQSIQLQIKSLHLSFSIVWILPSDERYKLGCDINSKLVLVILMTARTFFPRFPEFIHIISLLTFGCCESSQAGKVDKAGICASTCAIAPQWLVRLVDSPVKAQVAHRFPVTTDG